MTKLPVYFISSSALESWDWHNPWIKGIGGSETSHIEMVERLKNRGYDTESFAPIEPKRFTRGPGSVPWNHYSNAITDGDGIYIYYRNPEKFERPKPPHQKWWFIAQDVDYPGNWTEERLAKVDRYVCLCHEHAMFTLGKYPSLKGRIYTSSNGIRSEYIRLCVDKTGPRDPNRMLYPSSPDRGLKLLLEQWWRIREINPDAKLAVAYGFNNMKVISDSNPGDWRKGYQTVLEDLLGQPGIEVLGRIPQGRLYEEWFKSGLWAHPTDFPETSCITSMEAQACGAFPVTNDLWALKDNVQHGWMVQGIPQKSELVRHNWLKNLERAFGYQATSKVCESQRNYMRAWAMDRFNWERICDQWGRWIEEDNEAINVSI